MSNTSTHQLVEQFLSIVPQFNHLPAEEIAQLAGKLKPLRFSVGKVMVMRDKMQGQVAIVSEGEVRVLGYDPRTKMPTTLEKLKPGQLIGWVNLARGIACETAMASTEVVCLALDNQDFIHLIEKYPELSQEFKEKPATVEIFDLFGIQLEKEAQGDWKLKDLVLDAAPEAEIYYLPPGEHRPNTGLAAPLNDPQKVWLVSGGGEIEDFSVGSRIGFTKERQTIKVIGDAPARLLSIPRDKWFANDNEDVFSPPQSQSDNLPVHIPWNKEEIQTDEPLPVLPKQEEEITIGNKDYPFVSGRSTLEVGTACFQMISKYFGMPFRKEVINRVLKEQLERTSSLSLPLCGAVSELMGLNPQLVNIPAKAFTRLQGPCFVRWQDSLAVIYDISEKELVIAVPELGLRRYKPEEFLSSWGDVGEVLLLQKTKETPQERFGLSWFWPSIVKHKKILIEVFIASLFGHVPDCS